MVYTLLFLLINKTKRMNVFICEFHHVPCTLFCNDCTNKPMCCKECFTSSSSFHFNHHNVSTFDAEKCFRSELTELMSELETNRTRTSEKIDDILSSISNPFYTSTTNQHFLAIVRINQIFEERFQKIENEKQQWLQTVHEQTRQQLSELQAYLSKAEFVINTVSNSLKYSSGIEFASRALHMKNVTKGLLSYDINKFDMCQTFNDLNLSTYISTETKEITTKNIPTESETIEESLVPEYNNTLSNEIEKETSPVQENYTTKVERSTLPKNMNKLSSIFVDKFQITEPVFNIQIENDLEAMLFSEIFKKNTSIEELSINWEHGVEYLASALKSNQTITSLTVFDIWCNIELLAEVITCHSNLHTLRIPEIPHGDSRFFSGDMFQNTHITNIELASGYNGDEPEVIAPECLKMLSKVTTLRKLRLSFYEIDETSIDFLKKILDANVTLTDLDLSYCNFKNEATLRRFSEIFSTNTTITSLDLSGCFHKDVELQFIFESLLHTNRTLTSLSLRTVESDGVMSEECVNSLCKALSDNIHLSTLNISGNEIGDEGVKKLSKVLAMNISLTSLDISGNMITFQGIRELCKALVVNKTLTSLDISYNRIGNEGIRELSKALAVNKTLISIDIRCNEIGEEEMYNLFEQKVLVSNRTIVIGEQ